MTTEKKIQAYINRVISGKEIAGKYERLAIKRHLNDIETCYERGMYFDPKAGLKVVSFFQFLKHGKGRDFAGKSFELTDWQSFKLYVQFGWMRANNRRRFRQAYLDVGRKNGKTTLAAGESLFGLIADKEAGAEIYTAATKREQASICFNEAKLIIRKSPAIRKHLETWQYAITHEQSGSSMKALSSESKTLDGLNPHFVIIDEYHAHKTDELFNVLDSAMGARLDPMMEIITTAGFNRTSPCYRYREVAIKVLEGVLQQDDMFPYIFTLDEDDDWEDPSLWRKANPNLEVSLKLDYLMDRYKAAKNNPSKLYEFKTKNLNLWVDSAEVWMPDDNWQACAGTLIDLSGKECNGGLDLSSTRDLTALSLCFQMPDESDVYLWFFWMPEDNIQERVKNDRVPYDLWVNQGYIRTTPGNITDYDFIMADILQLKSKYNIKAISFDRWNSSQAVINLMAEGMNMVPFGQGYGSMSAPTKEFERTVFSKKMNHMGNPVMRWMISNVAIMRDPAGNIKVDKSKVSEKVDGVVAAIMAKGQQMTPSNEIDINKIYAERGIRTL